MWYDIIWSNILYFTILYHNIISIVLSTTSSLDFTLSPSRPPCLVPRWRCSCSIAGALEHPLEPWRHGHRWGDGLQWVILAHSLELGSWMATKPTKAYQNSKGLGLWSTCKAQNLQGSSPVSWLGVVWKLGTPVPIKYILSNSLSWYWTAMVGTRLERWGQSSVL